MYTNSVRMTKGSINLSHCIYHVTCASFMTSQEMIKS